MNDTYIKKILKYASAIILLSGLIAISQLVGLQQFAGYDASMMVNLAERLSIGQSAPNDFFSPMPPVFASGARLSFVLFGHTWRSLCLFGAIFYSLLCVTITWQTLSITANRWLSVFVGTCAFGLTGIFYGFWWHTPVASLLMASSVLGYIGLAHSRISKVIFSISCGLLLCSKPNLALAAPFFVMGLFLPKRIGGHGNPKYAFSIFAGSIYAAYLSILYSGQSAIDYITSLISISSGRATHFYNLPFASMDAVAGLVRSSSWSSLLLCLLSLVAVVISGNRRQAEKLHGFEVKTLLFALVVCLPWVIFSLLTNGDFYQSVLPAILVFAGPASLTTKFTLRSKVKNSIILRGTIAAVFAGLFLNALSDGFSRMRVFGAGPGLFWEPSQTSSVMHGGFFDDSLVGSRLVGFMAETQDALVKIQHHKIFFGPRVEFGYSAFQLPSPKGVPLWFDPEAAWPPANRNAILTNFKENNFDELIFLPGDVTGMPKELVEYINENYEMSDSHSFLSILHKKLGSQ